MPNRLDIEITSQSDESSYTWRSAGAREPKGTVPAKILPNDVSIGDVLRVEADFMIDGIEITSVLPTKSKKDNPEILEILGSGKDASGVTTSLIPKGKKRGRNNNNKRQQNGTRKPNEKRKSQNKKGSPERKNRKPYRSPRGKRLKASKKYRNEYVASLPETHKPLARQLIGSTIPNLRKTIDKMSLPHGFPEAILDYAEELNQQLKVAEWLDKADAIEENVESIDLQDFRSVVASSGRWAKSHQAIAVKERLENKLNERIDLDHKEWLSSIQAALNDEKTVRALNLSSRSPKAGAQLPEIVTNQLIEQASRALNEQSSAYRWAIVLEAVAFSPVREKINPNGLPSTITDELKETIAKHGERVPQIANLFN
ncbi:MAG: hypothetical protein CBC90_05515 [Acidimicrobiaceae bacterium TMED130]|nr:MAG: hypothetical protein CBC90_05515 [Acidimicrobiaceae bacterium TMED130]|tara:strand:- start:12505 stop:13617 length:1113 start_codon:yes stop_codon:yes gene_type:complete